MLRKNVLKVYSISYKIVRDYKDIGKLRSHNFTWPFVYETGIRTMATAFINQCLKISHNFLGHYKRISSLLLMESALVEATLQTLRQSGWKKYSEACDN